MSTEVLIYQTENHEVEVRLDGDRDTVWLSQAQMVGLFGRDVFVISRHIRNAINEGEVDEKSNLQKMHIANSDKPVATTFDQDLYGQNVIYLQRLIMRELHEFV